MMDLFSDDIRRNPFALYDQIRTASPLFREPQSGLLMIFDYEGVKRVLNDHDSSEPWEPRRGLHVHGPERLPIRFRAK